jgi:hypothetical protein
MALGPTPLEMGGSAAVRSHHRWMPWESAVTANSVGQFCDGVCSKVTQGTSLLWLGFTPVGVLSPPYHFRKFGRWFRNFIRIAFQARPFQGFGIARTADNHLPVANHNDVANLGSQMTSNGDHRRSELLGHGRCRQFRACTIEARSQRAGNSGPTENQKRNSPEARSCKDDRTAIEWAKQLVAGRVIELWCGERFVARLEPKPKPRG